LSVDAGSVVLELLAGFAAGVFAGLTGAGGGILVVPFLVWLGLPPLAATATSNVAISVSAASGTVSNTRKYDLPWRRVLMLAVPAVLLAPVGVLLARRLPGDAMLVAFAMFNLASIVVLQYRLRMDEAAAADATGAQGVSDDTGAALPPAGLAPILATGGGGGVLAGLFGIGGGLIMVPLQAVLLSTPVRMASRVSLAVVLFASASSVLTHIGEGTDIRWVTGLVIAAGGLLGAPLGARFLHRITDRQSTRLIQVVMIGVATMFLWRAFG
jgi:uncharacterized membrane protein YfcA